MYDKQILSNLPESIVDRANASILDHQKNRMVFDSEFAVSVMDAQYRCELELKRLKSDARSVYWPSINPVIGEMNNECIFWMD